jgi:nucleoside-diphosphate-sugar epimerase
MSMLLITGAPGWLGTRLVRALLYGSPDGQSTHEQSDRRRIRCLVLPDADISEFGPSEWLEIVRGDLRNPEAAKAFCRGAQGATLFHCAGIIHPSRFIRELKEVNVDGTQHLLRAAEEAGVRRAIVVSSNSVAGMNPRRDHRFDEASPYNPDMGYGRSKMLMEQVVHDVQSRGKVETVTVRGTWFYGPGQPERQTTFFRMIKNGTVPIFGDGGNLRSLTYVDSLSQAMLLAAETPAANGQIYWVADSRPYSMKEIVDTVEKLMEEEFGVRVSHRRLKLPLAAAEVAHFTDVLIQNLGFYDPRVHVLSQMDKTIACSIEKAQRELGYAPAVELEEGMRRSLAWLTKQHIVV